MTPHEAFEDAAAAYALDALDHGERAAFELHLASCAQCQRAVAELRDVTAALGASIEPVAPPESLKARTMARATMLQQAPAGADVTRFSTANRRTTGTGARSGEWLVRAASVLLIVGLGIYAASLRSQVSSLRIMLTDAASRAEALRAELAGARGDSVRLSRAMAIIAAPDVRPFTLRGTAGAPRAAGRAYFSGARGLVFAASELPPLRPGRVYQLWVIPPDSAVPLDAGVFSVDSTGSSPEFTVTLPPGVQSVKTVAVTEEPGPVGSPSASTPIILVGSAGD